MYLSSVKAAGDLQGKMDKTVAREPDVSYGKSKRDAEKLVPDGGCFAACRNTSKHAVWTDREKKSAKDDKGSPKGGAFRLYRSMVTITQ